MERSSFLREYTAKTRVSFRCSACARGQVAFPDAPRRAAGSFLQVAQCPACATSFTLVGKCRKQGRLYSYRVRYVDPPFDFFEIPNGCPSELCDQIRKAFQLSWLSREAAANAVRIAVELVLDNKNVATYSASSRKTSLHDRILQFHEINPEAGELLLATKWLGNEGSHAGSKLDDEAILDDLELLEQALVLLYGNRVSQIAKRVNKRRGV